MKNLSFMVMFAVMLTWQAMRGEVAWAMLNAACLTYWTWRAIAGDNSPLTRR